MLDLPHEPPSARLDALAAARASNGPARRQCRWSRASARSRTPCTRRNNVAYPITPEQMSDERYASGMDAAPFEHLCPTCLVERGWPVSGDLDDPEWPFIGCYSYNAPVVADA